MRARRMCLKLGELLGGRKHRQYGHIAWFERLGQSKIEVQPVIADACDLSTRLAAAVLNGQAPESVLDDYETDRRAAALEVLRFTDRMTKMAMLSNPITRSVRRVAVGTGSRIRPFRHGLGLR